MSNQKLTQVRGIYLRSVSMLGPKKSLFVNPTECILLEQKSSKLSSYKVSNEVQQFLMDKAQEGRKEGKVRGSTS